MANNSYDSPRDITRLVIGLLFGSGITGIAIGMIQGTPDARPWAMAIFVLSLIAAGVVYYWGERAIERQDKKGLTKLSAAYARVLGVLGQYVSGTADNPRDALGELATKLEDESKFSLGEGDDVEWVKAFKSDTKATIKQWRAQIVTSSTEASVPEDAVPEIEVPGLSLEEGLR